MNGVDAVLLRERWITAGGLIVLVALAGLYVWQGAGMGMSAADMTALSLFPHRLPAMAGSMETQWLLVLLMWWVMMIAMMTLGAAPLVLLYGRVLRYHDPSARQAYLPSVILLAGYLLIWLAFSAVATGLQFVLQPAGLLSGMMLWSKSAVLSAVILAAAGLYQLSPLKQACLMQCREPVAFLTQYWRPGYLGSLMLGIRHGAYCVGCCWSLMALLFVGGVMNVVWIAALALLIMLEKVLPAGPLLSRISGGLLIAWSLATLLV